MYNLFFDTDSIIGRRTSCAVTRALLEVIEREYATICMKSVCSSDRGICRTVVIHLATNSKSSLSTVDTIAKGYRPARIRIRMSWQCCPVVAPTVTWALSSLHARAGEPSQSRGRDRFSSLPRVTGTRAEGVAYGHSLEAETSLQNIHM